MDLSNKYDDFIRSDYFDSSNGNSNTNIRNFFRYVNLSSLISIQNQLISIDNNFEHVNSVGNRDSYRIEFSNAPDILEKDDFIKWVEKIISEIKAFFTV
ncbi:hypothetical protein [Acinetobacter populi]|uniref:Uncharacterized protein n=1 Tax=Acinetobacter populi TaxID=1582270 RepID=A0A1Z9YZN0_9GAMM|nr:hypothetical protein [Acinetobacter populi]OUY07637.1 hypothetical protein CAP51_07785 [Acinetobacter populi]